MIAVNKMDLVDYEQDVFHRHAREFAPFLTRLGVSDAYFLPLSALKGDNVVDRSTNMPWFDGHSLLEHLETVERRPARWMRRSAWPCSASCGRIMNFPRLRGPDRFGHGASRR